MKKLNSVIVLLLAVFTVAFAQNDKKFNETKVSKFEAGTTLSKADVSFIDLVSGGDASKSRGDGVKEAKLGDKVFKEGQKLTNEDIETIKKFAKKYAGANKENVTKEAKKEATKTRGCYYYCYYYYWNGYYYEYYYYCC